MLLIVSSVPGMACIGYFMIANARYQTISCSSYSFVFFFYQNSTALHCFGFADADYSPKTDVVRSPAPPGAKGAALTIHTLTLKGRKDLVSKMFLSMT